ncbi:MAG: ROK family protein [candidate division Zixibacteria bacterium]
MLFAGIDIGATNIKYGLVESDGKIKFRGKITTPGTGLPNKLFEKIIYCAEQLLFEADDLDLPVGYLGVGSPGAINVKTGVVAGACPNIPGWVGFHLRDRLSEHLNIPIFIDNDANCAGLAEYRFGAGQGYEDIICLTVGTGIGGGIIRNGEIYHGSNYSAGEIGHTRIIIDKSGGFESDILERLVSSRAILMRVKNRLEQEMTPAFQNILGGDLSRLTIRRVFSALNKGDKIAHDVINESARILGVALSGIVNLLNPELIIIGGGVAEGGHKFVDIARETIMSECLPVAAETLEVVPTRMGNDAGFIGAAFLGEGKR